MVNINPNYKTNPNDSLDIWNLPSPVNCSILKGISVYCAILLVLSLFFNTTLLMVFFKHKTLRTPLNMFIIALTGYNLVASIVELPFVITSNYFCR